MKDSIGDRISKFRKYLDEEYSTKPKKYWYSTAAIYHKKTNEINTHKKDNYHNSSEIIFRNDFKGLIVVIVFIVIIASILFLPIFYKNKKIDIGMLVFNMSCFVGITFIILKNFNKKPQLLFNTEGIWIRKYNETIPWQNIVASYLKEDDTGEETKYSLLIHYYNPLVDEFLKMECSVDNLDTKREEIVFQFEKFRNGVK